MCAARVKKACQTESVGIRTWFVGLLSRGDETVLDPSQPVEVADVAIAMGPLVLAALQDDGIEATGIESVDVVTKSRTRFRIMVRRADAERAAVIVDRVITR